MVRTAKSAPYLGNVGWCQLPGSCPATAAPCASARSANTIAQSALALFLLQRLNNTRNTLVPLVVTAATACQAQEATGANDGDIGSRDVLALPCMVLAVHGEIATLSTPSR